MHEEITAHLQETGYICTKAHPHLIHRVRHHAANGALARLLGGVYAAPDAVEDFGIRVMAAREAYPNCVFTRETAAKLSWWPDLQTDRVSVASTRRHRAKGFSFERREIPEELRNWDGTHFLTSPALTVLDLTDSLGGFAIDEGLRRGAVTLQELEGVLALTKGRPGNTERARLIRESRDEPWSPLEREAHVLLRKAQFRQWEANHRVTIDGATHFIDLAVPALGLAVEVHGWKHHRTREQFIADAIKWNAVALAGWTLLHFTAQTLTDLVPQMQKAAAMLTTRMQSPPG